MARELKAQVVIDGKVAAGLAPAFKFAQRECKNLSKTQQLMSKVWKGFGRIAATAAITGSLAIAAGLGYVTTHSIDLASRLNEVQNVVDSTFGKSAGVINAWAREANTSFGLSELQAKNYTGTLGAMLKSMGLTESQAVGMSTKMSGLAGDLASFYNLDIDEAFEKIRSGISGETEPLKQLGINLSEANLKSFAFAQGITKDYTKLDEASKAALRYAYLMSVTKDAQGDFLKTQDSFANQQRILKNNLDSTFAEFGKQLLPIANSGLQMLNQQLAGGSLGMFLAKLTPLADKLLPVFATLLDLVAGTVLPALLDVLVMLVDQIVIPLLPILTQLIQAVMPVLVSVLGIVIGLVAQLLPVISMLMPVINMLLPIISMLAGVLGSVLGSIISALMPVIQALANIIVSILSPILTALMPILTTWGEILGVLAGLLGQGLVAAIDFLTPYLEFLWGLIGDGLKLLQPLLEGIGKLLGVSGSTITMPAVNGSLPSYGDGGPANTPSIFGEDGPEMAIPLRRSRRSLSLLNQTAQALGADSGQGISITYAPVINGGSYEENKRLLDEDKPRFRNLVQSVLGEEERTQYA